MAPKQQTNWQLYKSAKDLVNPNMASWVEENNSLMKRLNDEKQKISLRVVLEKICQHDEKELNHINAEGNLRKIYLTGSSDIVFAESFFSNAVRTLRRFASSSAISTFATVSPSLYRHY